MLKIVYPICCGIDVHKTFRVQNSLTVSNIMLSSDIALAIDGTISEVQAGKITLCLSHMDDIKSYIAQMESFRSLMITRYQPLPTPVYFFRVSIGPLPKTFQSG